MLKQELEKHNLHFDELFYERCEKFTLLLKEWGKVHNLTSLNSLHDSDIKKNIVDSLYPLGFMDEFNSFADIGTGAGYPGLILAIAKPNIKAVLIEPRVKRVAFLNYVKNILGLKEELTIAELVDYKIVEFGEYRNYLYIENRSEK
ncbi:MAG: class I SAM-dependent methyltransferase [Arcobacter sp.]|nr:class I SAM-dependent methyltransferase [Arcobacter sp.]